MCGCGGALVSFTVYFCALRDGVGHFGFWFVYPQVRALEGLSVGVGVDSLFSSFRTCA